MKFTAKFLLSREEKLGLIEKEKAKILRYGKRGTYPEMERLGFSDIHKYYDYLCEEAEKLQSAPMPEAVPVISTPGFKSWFGKSKVVDSNGNPLVVYHGSGTQIEEFKYEFTELGNQQLGSCFYFTTDPSEAQAYTSRTIGDQPKPGGEDKPTVHKVYLSIQRPLNVTVDKALTAYQVQRLILGSPDLEDALSNFGDVSYEGRSAVVNTAINAYIDYGGTTLKCLFAIANDFYSGEVAAFNGVVKKTLGYDGVVEDFGHKQHWGAFFPNQIKSVNSAKFDRKSPKITASDDTMLG